MAGIDARLHKAIETAAATGVCLNIIESLS
jgi:hypothetical protein